MSENKVTNKLNNLKLNKDINILLLGTTGVGKSTLINAFANYLTYSDLKKAKKEKLLVLIPTQFTVADKNHEYHFINVGEADNNEYLKFGDSATQDVKTYVFPIWNGEVNVRLIDTPGMGDTRGIDQDNINSENILSYISQLNQLHAICFLLKPTETRDTVFFKYCMNQIFSRLDKSATENIIFCFTNTRGTDYSPGETLNILRKTVDEIASKPPHAKIPLNRNIFCFDNEPFRHLAAVQKNVEFNSDIKDKNKESWQRSAEQCWKLIHYICGDKENEALKPHYVQSTKAINEARRMINQLSQPLAEITQLIHHNMSVLERHQENLALDNASLEEMKSKLYMPVVTLEITLLTQPITVCSATKCCTVYKVAGKNVWHYKKPCHKPCYLRTVPKEIIGSPELLYCTAMGGKPTCQECGCDFKLHLHEYKQTTPKEIKERNEALYKNITNKEQFLESKTKLMENIKTKKMELDKEHKTIVETCAKFAHFLQNNAITPFNDSYKEYIEYLINREQALGKLCDPGTVTHLRQLLQQYTEIKAHFDEALNSNQGRNAVVTPDEINESIKGLFKLKHNGKKIKELFDCQKKARTKEFQNTEYIHKTVFKKDEKKVKSSDDTKTEKKDKGKEDKKTKDQDNKDKKHQYKGNVPKKSSRSATHDEPPPSYQESSRNFNQNYGNPNGRGYNGSGPFPPHQTPYTPHQTPYPPHQTPYQPEPFPHTGYSGQYQTYPDYYNGEYDININLKKTNQPGPNQSGNHALNSYANPNPYPNPGLYPNQGTYQNPHPGPFQGPSQPYPPNYPLSSHGGAPYPHQGYPYQPGHYNTGNMHNTPPRGYANRGNQGNPRGGYRADRGRGGVHKKNRPKKGNKDDKKHEKNKKKEKNSSTDSDSSDNSS